MEVLAECCVGFVRLGVVQPAYATAAAGVFLAHAAHLLAVLLLYRVSRLLSPALGKGRGKEGAWVAAALHALSPAGMFLSAPYAEGMFSLLSFAGAGLYAGGVGGRGRGPKRWGEWKGDGMVVAAGVMWGVAAMCRGNGMLWGLVFVVDALERVGGLFRREGRGPESVREELRGLVVTVLAGGCVGVGFVLPQVLAWREYCTGVEEGEVLREWCGKRVPSIYAWVQSHYW